MYSELSDPGAECSLRCPEEFPFESPLYPGVCASSEFSMVYQRRALAETSTGTTLMKRSNSKGNKSQTSRKHPKSMKHPKSRKHPKSMKHPKTRKHPKSKMHLKSKKHPKSKKHLKSKKHPKSKKH